MRKFCVTLPHCTRLSLGILQSSHDAHNNGYDSFVFIIILKCNHIFSWSLCFYISLDRQLSVTRDLNCLINVSRCIHSSTRLTHSCRSIGTSHPFVMINFSYLKYKIYLPIELELKCLSLFDAILLNAFSISVMQNFKLQRPQLHTVTR